jgi:hypothetical protein
MYCPTHKNETLKYFCATCNIPSKIYFYFIILNFIFSLVCNTCTTADHGRAGHEFVPLNDAGKELFNRFFFSNFPDAKQDHIK